MVREVKVGNRILGGKNPILIQSMLNKPAQDIEGNIQQARELEQAGCEIIRVSVPELQNVRLIGAL